MIAQLTNNISKFHSQLAEFITPFNDALQMPDVVGRISTVGRGLGAIEGIVTQQAAIMAYSNDFLIMTFVSLSAFPLLALLRSPRSAIAAAANRAAKDKAEEAAHAVMD